MDNNHTNYGEGNYGWQSSGETPNSYNAQSSYGTQNAYGTQYNQNAYGTQQSAGNTYANQNFYTAPQNPGSQPKPKKEKKNGFGATLAKTVAVALVFGLISGCVFTGVSYAGSKAVGTISENVTGSGTDDASVSGSTDRAENSSDASSDSAVDKTATGTGVVADLTDVSAIVEETMPSIVAITNVGTVTYRSFFGQAQTYESESCGSGIIISQDADYIYIVTNNHVVSGADTLTVQFVDDTTVSCEIQGTDSSDDLAVVKAKISSIDPDTLNSIKVATVGDSDSLKVGEATIAIGNALGYGQSVTNGIVSALGRTVTVTDSTTNTTVTNTNLIQTNAAINPGNSGGALLNSKGEVIGINSAKYSDTDVEGIGYAIPITDAMEIVNQLIETGTVTSTQTAYLGIKGTDVSQDMSQVYGMPVGVYVYSVISGSGAESAGLRQGDIITAMDGQTVSTMEELQSLLKSYEAGDTVTLTVERIQNNGYEAMQVSVTLSGASTITQ
jgi:serine protease Do